MSQFDKYIKIAQEMINEGKKGKIEMVSIENLKAMAIDQNEINKLMLFYDDSSDSFALGLASENSLKIDGGKFEQSEDHEDNIDKDIKKILKSIKKIENNVAYFSDTGEKSIKLTSKDDIDSIYLSSDFLSKIK